MLSILENDTVQKVMILLAGVLLGIVGTITTERIKRRYAKADERADLALKQASDRENQFVNVIRWSETVSSAFGNMPKNSWAVTPRFLLKDDDGKWRIRNWEQFELQQWQMGVGENKIAFNFLGPLEDDLVASAIARKEWIVFVEQVFASSAMTYVERQPCRAEDAHLFD